MMQLNCLAPYMSNRRMVARHRGISLIVGILLLGASGCGDGVGPLHGAGVYVLQSYEGRAPEPGRSGRVALWPDGTAVRVLGDDSGGENVARGSYRVVGTQVDLRLREDGGRSTYEWRPHTTLENGVLTLQYPHPADGPDIVEVYERQ